MHRSAAALLAAILLLLAAVAVPAQAVTLDRVFTAPIGGGAHGTVKITGYSDGSGRVDYALKGLRKGAVYRVEIRRKTCANLGSVAARIHTAQAGSNGAVTISYPISVAGMNAIWSANWSFPIAARIVSGTHIRCGNLAFPRASRVQLPAYGIDMAVVRGPSGYPYCNVGMFMGALKQPQESGVSFIYAHARKGMFLPLLNASKVNDGAAMIGKKVHVWTVNNRQHTYEITQVRRHVKSVQSAVKVTAEQLWLQTSEGPNFSYPKLVIVAKRVSTVASTYAAAHPKAKIVRC